ncbi:hypothetical protein SARC_01022 [Sphaeroforma arctica JP610]|uniref:Macro domain-containing protein n=1 Tax=Sphaeroforma arctica JP610 TaxID=667725 RepID=A0A0L0GD45_9EUKA|nr:hypothetical protein SARC_01022 [Sphaeroforma arctica JP610]KNC86829.1 hypothetical protein SARC_01022 [Sphaeroforma arctica JP610]|eukprot:XP_014160731.1 hypothetical protein SARC_01022 [Sphaeroforma arctica JP610]
MYVKLNQLRSWGTTPIAKKVFLYRGDSTKLQVDAIVNAANERMLGGGGIDGAIHRAAGRDLYDECERVEQVRPRVRCPTGEARLTKGYNLPAKHIIHTVGPIGEKPDKLESCYASCLNLAKTNNIRSLAFCSISTGVFMYPIEKATEVALSTTKRWLEEGDNNDAIDGIIFTVFSDRDADVYRQLLTTHFGPQHREVVNVDAGDDERGN